MSDERLELLEQLVGLSEQHLEAARALDAKRVNTILEERSGLLFSLSVAMQDGLPDDPELKQALSDGARRLRKLENRTQQVANVVLGALHKVLPVQPATYGRTGHMRP